jgi:hypothetical protein
MQKRILKRLVLPLLFMLYGAASGAEAPGACLADLEDAARYIAANDAGAPGLLADHEAAITRAFDKARADIAAAPPLDDARCKAILRSYFRAWRPGHLGVETRKPESVPISAPVSTPISGGKPAPAGTPAAAQPAAPQAAQQADDPKAPRFKLLGKDTVLLSFGQFNDRYAARVRQLIADHRAELASHPNWIIDVRDNGGGADGTYKPLLGWLLDGELPHHTVEFLVTPDNIKRQEEVCPQLSNPAACMTSLGPVIEAMRAAKPGTYVMKGTERISYDKVALEPKRPARVAILIDRDCGSTCEQFVLEARTSFRVKLVGRPTYGALDDSNMRPHPLPSGVRTLLYATTRSTRVPDMRIDGIGIPPDILLPKPQDAAARDAEVAQVQRWLEGGSLSGK